MKYLRLITFLSALMALAACVSTDYKVKAEDMQTKGLLIGTLVKKDSSFKESNSQLSVYGIANAKINGQVHENAVRGGKIMLQLPPGDYQLEGISNTSSSTGSIGMGVTLTTLSSVDHPIKARFSIKQGQVTNLGAIVVAYEDDGRMLKAFFVDDSREAQEALSSEHPKIYQSLSNSQFALADEKYLSDAELTDLRKQMVLALPDSQLVADYAHTNLGTIGKLVKNRKGEVVSVEIIETGTLKNIWNCAVLNHRFGCVVDAKKGRLVITEGKDIVERTIKPEDIIVKIYLVGKNTVGLVTEKMHILTSIDNAKSWHTYTDSAWTKPLKPNAFLPPRYLRSYEIGLSLGRDRYYLYSQKEDKTLLYWNYGSTKATRIFFPGQESKFSGLIETAKGLYTDPALTLFGDGTLYFSPHDSTQWRASSIPSGACRELKVLDYDQDKIAALCSAIMISSDSAQSWRQGTASDIR